MATKSTGISRPFAGSATYWDERYYRGESSGAGSEGMLGQCKAAIVQAVIRRVNPERVIDMGCGDGLLLRELELPEYLGFDVSPTAVALCEARWMHDPTKSFRLMDDYAGETAPLVLSLDVIDHLVEDDVFEEYMRILDTAAAHSLFFFTPNIPEYPFVHGPHLHPRPVHAWLVQTMPHWRLVHHYPHQFPYNVDTGEGALSQGWLFQRDDSVVHDQ